MFSCNLLDRTNCWKDWGYSPYWRRRAFQSLSVICDYRRERKNATKNEQIPTSKHIVWWNYLLTINFF